MVEKQAKTVGSLGFFGNDALTISPGALVDSYDSRVGSYTTQKATADAYEATQVGGVGMIGGIAPGGGETLSLAETSETLVGTGLTRVGCNYDATVTGTVAKPTKVDGNVTPGPANTVFQNSHAKITGSTAPALAPVNLPPIQVPSLPSQSDLVVDRGATVTLPSGQAAYQLVRVEAGCKLIVEGPLEASMVNFVVEDGAEIEFDARPGKIVLYVTDWLKLASGSTVSTLSKRPARTVIMSTGDTTIDRDGDTIPDPPVELASTGTLRATIYAPLAPVTIPSTLELYGSVAADDLTLGADAKVHFDRALTLHGAGQLGTPDLLSWRVIDLPDAQIVKQGLDPCTFLKMNAITPTKSAIAHDEILWKIKYVDLKGQTKLYQGVQANFDMTKVAVTLWTRSQGDPDFDDADIAFDGGLAIGP